MSDRIQRKEFIIGKFFKKTIFLINSGELKKNNKEIKSLKNPITKSKGIKKIFVFWIKEKK